MNRKEPVEEYFLQLLNFSLLWMQHVAKRFLAASTVATIALLSVWLVDRVDGFDVHTVNLGSGPMVTVQNGGNKRRVLRLCVDSGATSRCISKSCLDLIKVTYPQPKAWVKVASGSLLNVVAVGDLTLTDLSGFILEPDGTRTITTTCGTWHNMLVRIQLWSACGKWMVFMHISIVTTRLKPLIVCDYPMVSMSPFLVTNSS